MSEIALIVGLGNPGRDYENTRHNAGFWTVQQLAQENGASLQSESRFFGSTARIRLAGHDVRLLCPNTFMNKSGQSVAAMVNFFKIPSEQILVVHDELDIPCGTARFKQGGGHGGHNGLRSIIQSLGNSKDFHRLRVGIDHPGNAKQVSGYVLKAPSKDDRIRIDRSIDEALSALPKGLSGDWGAAMQQLHSFKI